MASPARESRMAEPTRQSLRKTAILAATLAAALLLTLLVLRSIQGAQSCWACGG